VDPVLRYGLTSLPIVLKKDKTKIENVQRRFTKRIDGFSKLTYKERLNKLNTHTLERKRMCDDLIMSFKIIHGLTPIDASKFFMKSSARTRQKLVTCFKTSYRGSFLSNRIVNVWNHLPEDMVLDPNLNNFKKKLENFDLSRFLSEDALK